MVPEANNSSTLVSPRARLALWSGVAAFLLVWNGALAMYANPLLLLQQHDGTQYHLLVRNRLKGHYEVDDTAHTVRAEGRNPMWRPGLVWIEEALAPLLGSVRASAALASAVGTTLLELAMLWLAVVCFGPRVTLLAGLSLLMPLQSAGYFLRMAVGQGPEPWAAAGIAAGLAALVIAGRRQSWTWAIVAGCLAGLAEWFRAGSYLIFLVPAALYVLQGLCWSNRKSAAVVMVGLATFLITVFAGGLLVPSRVNKTVVALSHRLQEQVGEQCIVPITQGAVARIYLSGLQLCPNLLETNCDFAVNQARDASTLAFIREHRDELAAVYLDGLRGVLATAGAGVRDLTGTLVFWLSLFGIGAGVVLLITRRGEGDFQAVAIAGGALAHYFGPIVLLRGADPTHYSLVILPFLCVLAAYGTVQLIAGLTAVIRLLFPRHTDSEPVGWPMLVMGAAPVVCLAMIFFHGAYGCAVAYYQEAEEDRAALAKLGLEGRTLACRSMGWFEDANVETVLLPYATAPEIAQYARAHKLDGILLWEKIDPHYTYFSITPYRSPDEFHQALEQTQAFAAPHVSGDWRWYPLRADPDGRAAGVTRAGAAPPG
jgi:hypothetical protein